VFDVLNEPTIPDPDVVNDLLMAAYEAIRKNAKGKTIMFEAYHAAKFGELPTLKLPEDGNIIFSGHYYEPYAYSHQGHSEQYKCKGDEAYQVSASTDFKSYVVTAKQYYPDKNGGFIPMNMGEFGISGQTGPCREKGPSDKYKAIWARDVIKIAESYEISWHYWGFVGVGGFEAYDKYNGTWYPGFPEAFGLKAE
jgi:endoglucanase